MLNILNQWNEKYDAWSLLSDFLFVFGVLVLDWSPILLIILLIIDTSVMLLFVHILYYLESKDWIRTISFILFYPLFIGLFIGLYAALMKLVEDVKLDSIINTDPFQILNPYILPIILVSSALNHYIDFTKGVNEIKAGIYVGTFIKHFFLRFVFIISIFLILAVAYSYFNATIVIVLIIGKALLRLSNKKYRVIL